MKKIFVVVGILLLLWAFKVYAIDTSYIDTEQLWNKVFNSTRNTIKVCPDTASTATNLSFDLRVTSNKILAAANTNRKYLRISNVSYEVAMIYLKASVDTAAGARYGIKLPISGDLSTWQTPNTAIYTGEVCGKSIGGTTEGTRKTRLSVVEY